MSSPQQQDDFRSTVVQNAFKTGQQLSAWEYCAGNKKRRLNKKDGECINGWLYAGSFLSDFLSLGEFNFAGDTAWRSGATLDVNYHVGYSDVFRKRLKAAVMSNFAVKESQVALTDPIWTIHTLQQFIGKHDCPSTVNEICENAMSWASLPTVISKGTDYNRKLPVGNTRQSLDSLESYILRILSHPQSPEVEKLSALILLAGDGMNTRQTCRQFGRSSMRVQHGEVTIGKLDQGVAGPLGILLVTSLIKVRFQTSGYIRKIVRFGDTIAVKISVHLNLNAFNNHKSRFFDSVSPEAGSIVQRSVETLLRKLLKWEVVKNSLIYQISSDFPSEQPIQTNSEAICNGERISEDLSNEKSDDDDSVSSEECEDLEEEQSNVTEQKLLNDTYFAESSFALFYPDMPLSQRKALTDPRIFKSELRPYQQDCLKWVLERERGEEGGNNEELHPLWSQFQVAKVAELSEYSSDSLHVLQDAEVPCSLQQSDDKAGRAWISIYMKDTTGELLSTRPATGLGSCRGGILADEMGTGKTVTMLGLISRDFQLRGSQVERIWHIVDRKDTTPVPMAGTLLCVPLSLVTQWQDEVRRHIDTQILNCVILEYHGPARRQRLAEAVLEGGWGNVDIILTTYGTLLSECHLLKPGAAASSVSSPLMTTLFRRIILDEAHMIKSRHSKISRAVCQIQAVSRWALTGTPIQNSVEDIYPLLRFLRHDPWDAWVWWTRLLSVSGGSNDKDSSVCMRLRAICTGILVRRTLSTIDPTTKAPMVVLPRKDDYAIWIQFSDQEQDFYQALFRRAAATFDQFLAENTINQNYTHVLSLITKLRQACCHPLLEHITRLKNSINMESHHIDSNLDVKGIDKIVKRILHSAKKPETCSKEAGSGMPSGSDEKGQDSSIISENFVRRQLINIQAGKLSSETCDPTTCVICLDVAYHPVMLHCGHVMCHLCVKQALEACGREKKKSQRISGVCPVCRQTFTEDNIFRLKTEESKPGNADLFGMTEKLLIDESGEFRTSTKMRCLETFLAAIMRTGHRAVIFSQWTSLLDVVECLCRHRDIAYSRLDGSMSSTRRQAALEVFQCPLKEGIDEESMEREFDLLLSREASSRSGVGDGSRRSISWAKDEMHSLYKKCVPPYHPDSRALLLSMRAGGVGLNLTAATHLFLLDSWWNHAVEEQAVQRVHRIGQLRPVRIIRIQIQDSIEKRIDNLKDRKAATFSALLHDSFATGRDIKTPTAWSLADLRMLFERPSMPQKG